MTVTQRVQGVGRWNLTLKPDTPQEIRDAVNIRLKAFSHLVVTRTRLDPNDYTDASFLGMAIYSGPYRKQRSELQLSGCGPEMWLGDEENKGNIIESPVSFNAAGLSAWIAALRPAAIGAGTVTSPGGTLTQSYFLTDPRTAIQSVCDAFGVEYRVNPNFTLDVGTAATLYGAAPTAVVVRKEADSGREIGVTGIQGSIEKNRDVEDYATKVILTTQDAKGVAAQTASSVATPQFRDPQGNDVVLERVVQQNNIDSTNASTIAAAELAAYSSIRSELALSANVYDISSEVKVGAQIMVFDQQADLVNKANPVDFRGGTIYPVTTRVYGATWPIHAGMGVYMRSKVGATVTYVDLSAFVEWETGDTMVEIGSPPRPSSNVVAVPQNVRARPAWTPAVNSGLTLGNGTIVGEYMISDGQCTGNFLITFGSTTVVTGAVAIVMPVDRTNSLTAFISEGRAVGGGVTAKLAGVISNTSNTLVVRAEGATANFVTHVDLSATVPFNPWGTGYTIAVSFSYPV